MNAAVLLFSACLAGADPVAAPAAPAAPAVVQSQNDSCGKASVCGDCCDKADKCCLLRKLKDKLFFWKNCDLCSKCDKGNKCDNGHKKGCNFCDKGCNFCDKGQGHNKGCEQKQVVVKQDCNKGCGQKNDCGNKNDCGKKDCCLKGALCAKKDCGNKGCHNNKDVCGKAEVNKCDDCCDKICWKPGYFLHKCKAKICGLCDKKDNCCHGGCGTAAAPDACGTTVIAPATPVVPAKPPETKKIPEKVGSAYPAVRDLTPAGASPRTIDLTPDTN